MPLTTDEIDRIATLARLRLTSEERGALPGQLQEIVGFVDQLASYETDPEDETGADGVSDGSSDGSTDGSPEIPPGGPGAEDSPAPCLDRRRVLANAPPGDVGGEEPPRGFFVVPEVT